ncbi:alpha/beta hydrolase [Streptomyces sp. GS7]|uniref:alpha/beta hydrolase n=1 Tax=Streptomyces sp. GS7 TaxID=2692234 RepID=UPI001315FA89|nr:alpha/beta hydrolase [Streptomyces sp. GS7]QHC23806.1 alpha/beta hydrolase fold domain-containing protein [Streptomyces sp. GS7]
MAYPYDPELAPWAPQLTPADYTDVARARAELTSFIAQLPVYRPAEPVEVEDRRVPGPPGAPEVPVRVYRPHGVTAPIPGLVYLHWGGLVSGDLDTNHSAVLRIAEQARVMVFSVDYRLAPEHPFPAGLHDSCAVLEWVVRHGPELGVDPDRLGVAGDSAGGALAAGLALLARDRGLPLRMQCLSFPELDDRLDTPSARAFVDTPVLDRGAALLSWHHYLGGKDGSERTDVSPYAAPARADDLTGLPATFLSACEFDPLRDEDLGYAARLVQAGVPTELHHYPGTFHACTGITEAGVSERMVRDQIDAIRRVLHG